MRFSAVLGKINETWHAHSNLTRAHHEAIRASRMLHASLSSLGTTGLLDLTTGSIGIARALQHVAKAERDCGLASGAHFCGKLYQEMLRHQRLAYIQFELLSSELQDNPSFVFTDLLRSAADIEHHVEHAELAHQAMLCSTTQQLSTSNAQG